MNDLLIIDLTVLENIETTNELDRAVTKANVELGVLKMAIAMKIKEQSLKFDEYLRTGK